MRIARRRSWFVRLRRIGAEPLRDGAGRLLAALLTIPATGFAEPARYEIDPAHVTVAFLVDHVGFARVLATFGDVEGSFVFDEETGRLTDISVTVATGSVFSHNDDRDEHIVSDDFLGSRRFPTMTFTAASAEAAGDHEFAISGELQLLGQTQPLTLIATWNKSGDYPIGRNVYAVGASARATLKRSDFGMDYGLTEDWVGDDVEILIELEARRQ